MTHTHWLFELFAVLHLLLVIALIAHILLRQKNYGVAIAWIVVLLFMPFVGVALYLIFGQIFISKRYQERIANAKTLLDEFTNSTNIHLKNKDIYIDEPWLSLATMGENQTGFGVQGNHRATLLADADHIFDALLDDINTAQKSILLEFYIIHPKGRVLEVFDALKHAKQRGVTCLILADSVGSMAFFASQEYQDLTAVGIGIYELFPVGLFKSIVARADIRNHRKLVCIDGRIGYTGSFNLIDPKLFKQNSNVGQWIDVMLRISHQDDLGVVKAMAIVMATDMGGEKDDNLFLLKKTINNYRQKLSKHRPKIIAPSNQKLYKTYPTVNNVQLQLLPSAPQLSGHFLYETIITALYNAKHSIVITTPYFVPDEPLMLALVSAKRRGVDVCIIMPKKSDSLLVQYASQAYFEPLLKEGITLALFEGGLLHSKIINIDKTYALFGTVNMDMRSFYLNMEVTLAIYQNPHNELTLLDEINELQQHYLSECQFLSLEHWQARKKYLKLLDGAVRLMSPLL